MSGAVIRALVFGISKQSTPKPLVNITFLSRSPSSNQRRGTFFFDTWAPKAPKFTDTQQCVLITRTVAGSVGDGTRGLSKRF